MDPVRILKSLNVLSGVPTQLLDAGMESIRCFKTPDQTLLSYDYRALAQGHDLTPGRFSLVSGAFGELFLLYAIPEPWGEGLSLLFGPFRCGGMDLEEGPDHVGRRQLSADESRMLRDYLRSLHEFALGDVRDVAAHVSFCFTGSLDDPLDEDLRAYVRDFYLELDAERVRRHEERSCDPVSQLYYYEGEVLSHVRGGDVRALRDMACGLSHACIPDMAGDQLRSQKDYSILVFEKLAQAGIESGMDIVASNTARDAFVRRTEQAGDLEQTMRVRDAAIVYFTSEVGKSQARGHSRLVAAVMQFIGLNLARPLQTQEIARAFHLSSSALQKKFKAETGTTIQHYITMRKVSESKVMLRSGLTVTEVAAQLGFFDSSHFSRVFKKATGMTPKTFQDTRLPKLPYPLP